MKKLVLAICLVLPLTAHGDEKKKLFDQKKAKKAEAVLRVKTTRPVGGSKYIHSYVKVLDVFKNKTGEKFEKGKEIRVACYSFGAGLPSGEYTVYLVHYNKDNPKAKGLWKVVETPGRGTKAEPGYSHASGQGAAPRLVGIEGMAVILFSTRARSCWERLVVWRLSIRSMHL